MPLVEQGKLKKFSAEMQKPSAQILVNLCEKKNRVSNCQNRGLSYPENVSRRVAQIFTQRHAEQIWHDAQRTSARLSVNLSGPQREQKTVFQVTKNVFLVEPRKFMPRVTQRHFGTILKIHQRTS